MPSDAALSTATIARGLGAEETIRWPLRRADQLFSLRYGKSLVEASRRHGYVPVFGTNGQAGWHDTPLFQGPGVILGRKGMGHLGVEWCGGDFWVIDTAYALEPLGDVDLRFAYYLIRYVGLDHLKHGTSNPSLTREAFGSQYFPVPPLRHQRGIAATLGALDDKIESNRGTIMTASDLLDTLSRLLADKLRSVPLNCLVTVDKITVEPTTLADTQVDHFSLPAFDAGVRPERVTASSIMSGKLAIKEPAILVSRLNPRFNRTWWAVPTPGIPALASTEFACLTTGSREDLAAIWLAVRDEYFRAELIRRASGTSGSHQRVRPDDLLTIDVPDVRELTFSVKSEALALLDLIYHRRLESVSLANLRDTLLPELLSGRIRVPEAREAVEEAAG